MLRKLFLLTLFLAAAGYSQTNTASANADATMSLPIAVYTGTGISFGGFMPGATPGTVVIPANPLSPRTASGGVTLVAAHDGDKEMVTVAGEPNASYTFTLPPDPVSVKLAGNPAVEMTLTDIVYYTGSGSLQLESSGYQYVYFGGTLNVAADQLKGSYWGSFEITATYQ